MAEPGSRSLLIRADASSSIGAGHLMRCFALAQAWMRIAGPVTFCSRCESEDLRRRVEEGGARLVHLARSHPDPADLETVRNLVSDLDPAVVVLDGYFFDLEYQRALRAAGPKLAAVDDYAHLPEYDCDFLLNQNFQGPGLNYVCPGHTRKLLGPSYALLRPEFLAWKTWSRRIEARPKRILVTLGGADPDNASLKVIRVLKRPEFAELESKVIVGPANPHIEILKQAAAAPSGRVEVLGSVSNMPDMMAWADLALCAGGSTCWELAFMGLPAMVQVLAENQAGIAGGIEREGVGVNLGWFDRMTEETLGGRLSDLMKDAPRRAEMSRRGRNLVDGLGADRVVRALTS
jgi:UDP-2,4-diacetamido-2,4,6-trideoxy-beta-L-altropyranose hydrolase